MKLQINNYMYRMVLKMENKFEALLTKCGMQKLLINKKMNGAVLLKHRKKIT